MGKWCSLATLDMIDSFSFGYEFRALKSACIRSRNTEEKSGSGLADAHTEIFNMSSPSRIMATLSMIFLSRFR